MSNVFGQHFQGEFVNDAVNGWFSLLLEGSDDSTVKKLLGMAMVYFSNKD